MLLSPLRRAWHYKYWQRQTAGYLRTFEKNNKLPNNEMVGYVMNDKHPKSIRVACDRYMWVMRYKKAFRFTKKVWAHDEHSECRLGDVVRIQPLGYRIGPWKTYVLVKILHREPRDAAGPTDTARTESGELEGSSGYAAVPFGRGPLLSAHGGPSSEDELAPRGSEKRNLLLPGGPGPGTTGWSLGPFASGKAEYDGDPLVPLGGVHRLFERKNEEVQEFLAEHAAGGRIAWREAAASSGGRKAEVQLPFDHINFQGLMQHPPTGGSSDVLHVQYWTVGHLKVKEPGVYGINCRNLHTFELQAPNGSVLGPLLGNSDSAKPLDLLGSQVPLRFACVVEAREALSARVKSSNLPDLVRGRLLADPAPLDLRVLSGTSEWRRVRAEVEDASGRVFGASVAPISLAPGAVAQLPVMISVASYGAPSDQEASSCLRFAVSFFDDDTRLTSVPVALRCRRADQSALFAFLDADGSVAVAAVLPPRMPAGPRAMCPVLVSLSGVGVEPQGQADAYKTKGPQEADYTFGFENMWVLAPQRDGPHNWEDRGLQSVFRAIDALVAWTAIGGSSGCAADADRLVVHGHSRGAHGAWGLATAAPDRVLGVAASCGWYSREESMGTPTTFGSMRCR
ncbi:unnamed protein product [Effrenium voratum]|nr:unnamed protein product [Effrenium voratum]